MNHKAFDTAEAYVTPPAGARARWSGYILRLTAEQQIIANLFAAYEVAERFNLRLVDTLLCAMGAYEKYSTRFRNIESDLAYAMRNLKPGQQMFEWFDEPGLDTPKALSADALANLPE